MAIVNKACIRNCAICELQLSGEVDLIPCALNQLILGHVRLEDENKEIKQMLSSMGSQSEKEANIAYGTEVVQEYETTSDPE